MMNLRTTSALGALLLFGAAGCADLEVRNPNDPDRGQALATPGDVESLVSGAFNTWHTATETYFLLPLSIMSFEHSAPWNNFNMVPSSALPRPELINATSGGDWYSMVSVPWTRNYRALAAVADGLRTIDDPETGIEEGLVEDGGQARVDRLRAIGKLVQALAHGNLAATYDRAFIVDETTDLNAEQEAVPYEQVMEAAFGYFDEAIQIASASDFEIPETWMTVPVTSDELVRIAHSYRAAYRAAVARTPEDRSLVDWNAVLADIDAGVQETWEMEKWYPSWWTSFLDYGTYPTWQQMNYMILGMADQSGVYQDWLATPIEEREPILNDNQNVLLMTPDQRFPQGSTLAEQQENPGTYWEVPSSGTLGSQWSQPARGTWRWSYYKNYEWDAYNSGADEFVPELEDDEMRLLAAEAHYWLGDLDQAAALINVSRTAAGLSATDASGTNTSCVPKLPNGECGDLLEMLKWEKRLETWHTAAVMSAGWYFDSRRWGDHYAGTALQFPIPAGELQTLQMPVYTFGGQGGDSASPGSSYAFPFEQ